MLQVDNGSWRIYLIKACEPEIQINATEQLSSHASCYIFGTSNTMFFLNCVFLYMYKWTDADRAQKHGMDEFISSNPCNFDHAALFEMLQRLTLDHRLNDSYSCLASIFFGLCDVNSEH